ncbi:TPA: HEPN domain-containing protein [Vibrio alginolyticus]
MVVISSTIFEALLNEFLKCYFLENPQKMYNYASVDGNVKFKDILQFSSKEELLNHYACVSAKRFTGKTWKTVLNNLEKLLKLGNEQRETLLRMLEVRNEIIHEASKKPVEHDDVFDFINAVKDFANSISSKVKHNKQFKSDS